ncbi:MAG: hypothetical protein ACOC8S_05070 [Bacteroidota bacterium]
MDLVEFKDLQKKKFAYGVIRVLKAHSDYYKNEDQLVLFALRVGLEVQFKIGIFAKQFEIKEFNFSKIFVCINSGDREINGSYWVSLEC